MIAWADFQAGNHRARCPDCGRKDSDKTLGITVGDDGRAVAHCFRCNYVETYRLAQGAKHRPGKVLSRSVAVSKYVTLADWARALWGATKPIPGAAVPVAYLKARACVVPPKGSHLRWLPELKHPSGYVGPALVGLITHVSTRAPLSLHRTWIKTNGDKAEVDPPRLLLKDHRKAEGVIRLWPDVSECLGIAEGIESALSLAHAVGAVWSCIDASNLTAFPVVPGVSSLVIGVDNDPAGIKAANACGARWAAADREVRLVVPEREGCDLNDVVRGQA